MKQRILAMDKLKDPSLTIRLADALDTVMGGRLKAHFAEAATATDDDPRANEYRRLSTAVRDLLPLQYDQGQRMCFYLWQRNPLARRIIKILVDFCTGDDFQVKVKIKQRVKGELPTDTDRLDAQELWDRFARDPVNRLESDLPMFLTDLLINGELINPATVNLSTSDNYETVKGDGMVRLGYIDPINVVKTITDPMNVREVRELAVRSPSSTDGIRLSTIHVDIDPNSQTYNKMMGACFYFRINHVVNQTRGHGELLDIADWLDALDQFLFDALDGFRLRNSFFYDLTFEGLTEEQIDERVAKLTVPANGSVRAHNEKAKYDVITPDLKAVDVDKALLSLQTFLVGAKGFPSMWFGSGTETNKATAGEMAIPTNRMLRATQKTVRTIIKTYAQFVMDQAEIAGSLRLDTDEFIDTEVTMFDFEKKDADAIAVAFTQFVTGLSLAVVKGWVSEETAKKVLDSFLIRLGIEIDTDETVEDNLAQQQDRVAKTDANAIYPPGTISPGMTKPSVVMPPGGNGTKA